jgi:hypothetical protein
MGNTITQKYARLVETRSFQPELCLRAHNDNRLTVGNAPIVPNRTNHILAVFSTRTDRFQLTGEGLEFRVFRGENLSGEAFETLSILLADIAVTLMGSLGKAAHPGILIHDSPREADLGGHIYRRMLFCVADVANELKGDGTVPFQHIVTTTTPPPTNLKKKSITRLKLGGEEGQLFGRQLHSASTIQSLLPFYDEQINGDDE